MTRRASHNDGYIELTSQAAQCTSIALQSLRSRRKLSRWPSLGPVVCNNKHHGEVPAVRLGIIRATKVHLQPDLLYGR